jgi:hypothetical protein
VGVGWDPQDHRLLVVTAAPDARPAVLTGLVAAGVVPWLVRDRGMELDEIYQRYFAGSVQALASPAEVTA